MKTQTKDDFSVNLDKAVQAEIKDWIDGQIDIAVSVRIAIIDFIKDHGTNDAVQALVFDLKNNEPENNCIATPVTKKATNKDDSSTTDTNNNQNKSKNAGSDNDDSFDSFGSVDPDDNDDDWF